MLLKEWEKNSNYSEKKKTYNKNNFKTLSKLFKSVLFNCSHIEESQLDM